MQRTSIKFIDRFQTQLITEDVSLEVRPDSLLIRTLATVVSTGTEGIAYARDYSKGTHWDQWLHYPLTPGYLNCGVVEAVGKDVKGWQQGELVASGGAHTSHFVLPHWRVAKVPAGVSPEEAAWTHMGLITQVGARAGQQLLGESVVVVGLGMLGQLVCQYAAIQGAKDVIVIDPSPMRIEMARQRGATLALSTGVDRAARDLVFEITKGRGADVVYDITGNAKVLAPALALARRYANIVLLGDTGHTDEQHVSPDLIVSGLRIIGAHASHIPEHPTEFQRWSMQRCYELFLDYVARRKIDVAGLTTHRYRPEQAPQAYDMLYRERATAMGVIFNWD